MGALEKKWKFSWVSLVAPQVLWNGKIISLSEHNDKNEKFYLRKYINWYTQLVMFILQCQKDGLVAHCISSEFNLIFQKWFVNFLNKNYCKPDLKCWLQWLGENETFPLYIIWNSLKQHFFKSLNRRKMSECEKRW